MSITINDTDYRGDFMSNITKRTISGFTALIVIMGALIFIPAWTFNYIQAWLYLLTFSASTIAITVYLFKNDKKLLERRLNAGASAEKEESQKIIQGAASVFFCLLYIAAGLDHRFNWSEIPLYIAFAADIFVGLGFYVVYLVFKENSYTSAAIQVDKEQRVISSGLYSIIRHPMYSGAIIMLMSSSVALGSYWSLICVGILTVVIIVRLLNEEKYLANNLQGYKEYCNKVRFRLIPFIW